MSKNIDTMNPPVEVTTTFTDVALAKESQKRNKTIKTELQKIDTSFERIAFNLHWFYRTKAYEQLGYKAIADFTTKEYGIAKATAYNFINVVERFAKRNEQGEVIDEIRDEFKEFKSSKLIALLDVPMDEQLEDFNSDMSVRDIKKKVKELNSDTTEQDADATTDDTTDSENVIDTTAQEIHRQEIIGFDTLKAYYDYLDGVNDLIEKNLKSKAFKDGKHRIEVSIVWTE